MKKRIFLLALCALLLAAACAQAKTMYVVNPGGWDQRLHLRTKPDKSAPSLGRYYTGVRVQVLGQEGEWCRVRIASGLRGARPEGYMMASYLRSPETTNLAAYIPVETAAADCRMLNASGQQCGSLRAGETVFVLAFCGERLHVMNRSGTMGYIGKAEDEIVIEQQLSGHSWLLRGLCEHYEQFGDAFSLHALKAVTENLFLPTRGIYSEYPVDRENTDVGGVSGTELGMSGRWLLSTDVGCAFMSVDGLSHVYQVTKDPRVKELLDEMIGVYLSIDKLALRVQTHCTLTAARGMMRMYANTADERYLSGAKELYDL